MCVRTMFYCLRSQSRRLRFPRRGSAGDLQLVSQRGCKSLEGRSRSSKAWFVSFLISKSTQIFGRDPEDETAGAPQGPHWWRAGNVHMRRGSDWGPVQGNHDPLWAVHLIHAACLPCFGHPAPLTGSFRLHLEELTAWSAWDCFG